MSEKRWQLHRGDCRQVLAGMAADSMDAGVMDPPYEYHFMGKAWDGTGVAFERETWAAVLRVLKPGAFLAVFGGTRTAHRMVCAIEDAGFEVRDSLAWIYGSGFPKSRDVRKAMEGDEQWQGWGTALKPAHEPIMLARKPLCGTVAENVRAHGTGGLNIDGCRVPLPKGDKLVEGLLDRGGAALDTGGAGWGFKAVDREAGLGRYPANVVHDGSDPVRAIFPEEAGAAAPASGPALRGESYSVARNAMPGLPAGTAPAFHGDRGSAARFFPAFPLTAEDVAAAAEDLERFCYCGKACRADREAGLEGLAVQVLARSCQAQADAARGEIVEEGAGAFNVARLRRNHHPTVKPVGLMRWLVRLVTPRGGVVLDAFAGSGSTGKGALLEGFSFEGIDLNAEYWPIIEGRLMHAEEVRRLEEQQGDLFAPPAVVTIEGRKREEQVLLFANGEEGVA